MAQPEQERLIYYLIDDLEKGAANLSGILFRLRGTDETPEGIAARLVEAELSKDPYDTDRLKGFLGLRDGNITRKQAESIDFNMRFATMDYNTSNTPIDNLRYLAEHPNMLTLLVTLHDAVITKNLAVLKELRELQGIYREQAAMRKRLENAKSGDDISDIIAALASTARDKAKK